MPEYNAMFKRGERVKIRDKTTLITLQHKYKLHPDVARQQIAFADKIALVEDYSYYHGGAPLYKLEGLPNVWYEEMLS